jgi:signal transduction histidine kinase
MTVPLEQVTRATADIARGQFDLTLGIATGDEVEELAVAVQRMAEDLKTYQAELIKSAKLATIGEMASEISHEIQNRISGLSLWLQYLDAEVEADDPKREYLKEMKQGLQGFMELLAALKQFYRTPILQLSEVNLNELVRESLPYIQERIEARKINVELQLDSSLPLVTCDAEKITSVILNLLVNAVDAVADGGRIRIHTGSQNHPDGQTAILSVTDNGQGIAEEDLPRIFYPFYSTKAGGSGLGLAIASNLILAHGGKIEVKSRVGEGTTFTVILPQASALADRTVVGTQFSDLEDRVVDL